MFHVMLEIPYNSGYAWDGVICIKQYEERWVGAYVFQLWNIFPIINGSIQDITLITTVEVTEVLILLYNTVRIKSCQIYL